MAKESTIQLRRHRGMILQFIRDNHHSQLPPMDDLSLWALVMDMGYHVGQNYIVTLVEELKGAGYLNYTENFNRVSGKMRLEKIMITSEGRRLVEGYKGRSTGSGSLMGKARKKPRTGEPRIKRQPLIIDRLPMDVLEAVKRLRAQHGLTWEEIERLSSLPYGDKWEDKIGTAGFVNWDVLATDVLELFPRLRLSQTALHRWYDIRVDQAKRDIARDAAVAHEVGTAFAAAGLDKDDEAVINAARDISLRQLVAAKTDDAKTAVRDALVDLAHVMQKARTNDIREELVVQNSRKLDLLERKLQLVQKKSSAIAGQMEAAADKGKTPDLKALAARVRQIYGA